MHLRRTSRSVWSGPGSSGSGTLAIGRGDITLPFSVRTRVGEQPATNPEELIAAAQAGCFAMSLANVLEENGTPAESITADATVHLVQGEDGFTIPRVDLRCVGAVPGVGAEDFRRMAAEAEAGCTVAKLLDAEIVLDARLDGPDAAG